MGRPRKSMLSHEISGAMRKNPQRFREAVVAAPRPIGYPPVGSSGFGYPGMYDTRRDKRLREVWDGLVKESIPGFLTFEDRDDLQATCELLAKVCWGRSTEAHVQEAKDDLTALGIALDGAFAARLLKGK